MPNRPTLLPNVVVLHRQAGCVQVGRGTSDGVVISNLAPDEIQYLESLQQGRPALYHRPNRAADLVDLLRQRGLLAGPPIPRPVRLWLVGDAEVNTVLAPVLTQADYEVTETTGTPALAGAPHRLRSVALTLITGQGPIPYLAGEKLLAHRIPHLPVWVDGGSVTVGPVVTGNSACLQCIDLTRCDIDPQWPALLAQSSGHPWLNLGTPSQQKHRKHLLAALTLAAVEQYLAHRAALRDPLTGALLTQEPAPAWAGTHSWTWTCTNTTLRTDTWTRHPNCPAHDRATAMAATAAKAA